MDNHREIKMAVTAVSPVFQEAVHLLGASADMFHTVAQFYQENAIKAVGVDTSQLLGQFCGDLATIVTTSSSFVLLGIWKGLLS